MPRSYLVRPLVPPAMAPASNANMPDAHSGNLLQRSLSGDAVALAALMQRHLPGARAFVRVRMSPLLRAHESGSDLVQSACRELLAKAAGFEYRGEEAFRAWLFTAVLNKLLKQERELRAQKRDARRQVALDAHSGADGLAACYSQVLSPSGALIAEERVRALEVAFDDLPDHYREVISLSRIARLSRAQVAEQMGRSQDSVRNLLPRALVALAEVLKAKQSSADE